MEIFEAAGNGSGIEPRLVGREGLYVPQVSEQLSSVDEFKHDIEILRILGETFESHYEGVVDLWVHKVFIIDVVYLLGLHDLMLV